MMARTSLSRSAFLSASPSSVVSWSLKALRTSGRLSVIVRTRSAVSIAMVEVVGGAVMVVMFGLDARPAEAGRAGVFEKSLSLECGFAFFHEGAHAFLLIFSCEEHVEELPLVFQT